jgi:histidine phosphotransfer protein HptB
MIDWTRISELREEIGEVDLHEVISLFLEETDEVVARLAQNPKLSMLEAELHFLKGSALNLGFADLAELCQDGERKAAKGDGGTVDVARIIALYYLSKATFLDGVTLTSAA